MAGSTLFCDPPQDAVLRAPALGSVRVRQDWLLCLLFVALVSLPLIASVWRAHASAGGGGKQKLAALPPVEANWASRWAFGGGLQSRFQDTFGFREALIRAHALFHSQILGVSPSPTVLWGRDGWLFYAGDGGIEDIIADAPMSENELEVWRRTLVDNRNWLRARGIEYVFTLAPDKHEIYPEFLPSTLRRTGRQSRLEQLAAFLREHTDLVIVDLEAPLVEAKAHERVFDRTDSHWNRRGAYVAYETIMGRVAAHVSGVQAPWSRADFAPTRTTAPGQDLAVMLGLDDVISEESLGLAPMRSRQARVIDPPNASPNGDEPYLVTEVPGSALPKAVVFRDSFTSRLIPYLSEHFSRTVYLWQNDMDPAVVLKERPAVVIHEIVGRHLGNLVPYEYEAVREEAHRP
jgi:alginate O-acetyltransferase complex protein AlgJ